MKSGLILRISADIAMTVILLLLMTYELVGQAAHEWLGIAMFLLFAAHHVLNRRWLKAMFRGKYTPMRILQTATAALVLLAMVGSAVSGVMLSRYVFTFLPISGGAAFACSLHMICSYWGFVLMSVHLGLHWGMLSGVFSKKINQIHQIHQIPFPKSAVICLEILVGAAAAYGVYAFIKRSLPGYMVLQDRFVFFDHSEPLALFLADYVAIMLTLAAVGHFAMKLMKYIHRRNTPNENKNAR